MRGSDIVRLQDLNIFDGRPSTPVAFLEPDFEMRDCYIFFSDRFEVERDVSGNVRSY